MLGYPYTLGYAVFPVLIRVMPFPSNVFRFIHRAPNGAKMGMLMMLKVRYSCLRG